MKTPSLATIEKLFDTSNRYFAPVFQRLYVWKNEQLEALFTNIDRAMESADDGKSFLGAIVLQDLGRSGPTMPHEFLIIDGQQRLSTLYMILACLAELAIEFEYPKDADYIVKRFLSENADGDHFGKPKLIPTLQDRSALWNYLEEYLPNQEWDFDESAGKPGKDNKLEKQISRIYEELVSRLCREGELSKPDYDSLLSVVLDGLEFVQITLDKEDDANEIFHKLNFEGVPLEVVDLVRNEIFSKLRNDPREAQKFHKNMWVPFETAFIPKSLDQFFFPYAIIRRGASVTQASSFQKLHESWKNKTPEIIVSELDQYREPYLLLWRGADIEVPVGLEQQTDRVQRMPRTRVIWPFLMELYNAVLLGELKASEAAICFDVVESFMVRRALVGWEPTGLHAIFKSLWSKTKGDPLALIDKIVSTTIKYPSDEEICHVLTNQRSDSRKILKYVFQEYEIEYRESKRADELSNEDIEKQTVEHILPQTLTADWKKLITEEEHEKSVGMIGNLLPLSSKMNKSEKANLWTEKRNRLRVSNWLTNQQVSKDNKSWGPTEISTRSEAMAEWCVDRWPELDSLV